MYYSESGSSIFNCSWKVWIAIYFRFLTAPTNCLS